MQLYNLQLAQVSSEGRDEDTEISASKCHMFVRSEHKAALKFVCSFVAGTLYGVMRYRMKG